MEKVKPFECKRLGKHIVQDEGHVGSEREARMVTAVADLDHYEVSLAQRDCQVK